MVDKFYFGNKTREIASKGKRKLKEAPEAINKGGAIILKGPKTGFINRQRKRFEDAQERRLEREEARLAILERKAAVREKIAAQKERLTAARERVKRHPGRFKRAFKATGKGIRYAQRGITTYKKQTSPSLPKLPKSEVNLNRNKIFKF